MPHSVESASLQGPADGRRKNAHSGDEYDQHDQPGVLRWLPDDVPEDDRHPDRRDAGHHPEYKKERPADWHRREGDERPEQEAARFD